MTIQRQYSLPNCKLILQGLSEGSENKSERRPCLSILMSAECHFVGYPQPLTGGREFFESLVRQVSQYTQGFLSGISSPNRPQEFVQLERVGEDLHRLTVHEQNDLSSTPSSGENKTVQLDLTTVQLFDLVEAVDQVLADPRTLPELSLQLKPIGKRHVKPEQPIAQRVLPATVGISSVAVAAIAFFVLPVPEVKRPQDPTPQPQATETNSQTNNTPNAVPPSPTATTAVNPTENLESTLTPAPKITDSDELKDIETKLYEELDQAWEGTPSFSRDIIYRVTVAKDGAILGYSSLNGATSEEESQIPLSKLLYRPVGSRTNEPLADFEVIFQPNGILEVRPNPTTSDSSSSSNSEGSNLTAEMDAPDEIARLNQQIYDQVDRNWTTNPDFDSELVYHVGVMGNGEILKVEPQTQSATDFVSQTPLPDLQTSMTIPMSEGLDSEPLDWFKVVFTPSGNLQVSPLSAEASTPASEQQ